MKEAKKREEKQKELKEKEKKRKEAKEKERLAAINIFSPQLLCTDHIQPISVFSVGIGIK